MRGVLRLLLSCCLLVGPITTAFSAEVDQQQLALDASRILTRAGALFKAGKHKESAAEIARCQAIVQQLLNENGTENGRELIRPFAGRLKNAHAMLELQGFSLPTLKFTADAASKPADPPEAPDDAIHFARDIAPILIARCGRCHIEKSEGDLSFRTFTSLMAGADGQAVIEAGDADSSALVEMIRSGDMPATGRKMARNQVAKIAKWIDDGAKFDGADMRAMLTSLAPDAKIEPAPRVPGAPKPGDGPVSFAGHIAPVLAANCVGCHGARNPRGRLSMVDFTRLMRGGENGTAIDAGKGATSLIVRKLRGTSGARMPLDRPALPPATIAAFERWIKEGAKFDGQNPAQTLTDLAALYMAKTATHEELAQQRAELADKNWKLSIPDEQPNVVELGQLRLYGTVDESRLNKIGSLARDISVTIRSLLDAPRDHPLIKGGVNFFVFSRRIDYSEFGRMVEKRTLPRTWRGHGKFTITDAYVAMVPSKSGDESLPLVVAQHLTSVYLGNLTAGKGPRWLTEGLARAVAAKVAPRDDQVKQWQDQLADLKKAVASPEDFLTPTLPPDDADVLAYGFAASLLRDGNRLNRFLAELRKGAAVEDGFQKAFGTKVNDRAESWLKTGARRRRTR